MDIYKEQIHRIVYEQRNMLEEYTNEYRSKGGPDEDRLIRCRNNGKDIYYRARRENGKYVRKSLGKDQSAVNALARKEYLRAAIETLSNNVEVLEAACGKIEDADFDSVRARMYKACRELPDECFFGEGACRGKIMSGDDRDRFRSHRAWAKEPFRQSDYKPERRRYMTSAGFRVRSKSEQHIVEQLENYGVPFRYEQVVEIDGLSYSADFTFRDCNKELFYWEHAGMMDDPKYVSGYYRKMRSFDSVGIVPWKNLIITYDIDGTISVPLIKSIIENDVIPRM